MGFADVPNQDTLYCAKSWFFQQSHTHWCHNMSHSLIHNADADDVITPEDVFDIMEEDVQQADLILWVGISFEQSASTAYFRRVSLSLFSILYHS